MWGDSTGHAGCKDAGGGWGGQEPRVPVMGPGNHAVAMQGRSPRHVDTYLWYQFTFISSVKYFMKH